MAKLNIEISDKLNEMLVFVTKELDHSKAYIIHQALENYLEELKEDIEDYHAALEAEKDDSPNISWEEVQRECGLLEN